MLLLMLVSCNDNEKINSLKDENQLLNAKLDSLKKIQNPIEEENTSISYFELLHPSEVIRNSKKTEEIEKIIQSKNNDYQIIKNEYNDITVINEKTSEEYQIINYTGAIENYSVTFDGNVSEVKNKISPLLGISFDEYNLSYIDDCYLVSIEAKNSNQTTLNYSFECD